MKGANLYDEGTNFTGPSFYGNIENFWLLMKKKAGESWTADTILILPLLHVTAITEITAL